MQIIEGWSADPSGRHRERLFSDGQPTNLVRSDEQDVYFDDIPIPLHIASSADSDTSRVADWYPDPTNPAQLRFWDGSGWTEHLKAGGPSTPSITTPSTGIGYARGSSGPVDGGSRKTNGFSIASLVLGLVPFVLFIGSILAIIFGVVAKRQIDESRDRQGGRGMANWGIGLGWLGITGSIILVIALSAGTASANHRAYNDGYAAGMAGTTIQQGGTQPTFSDTTYCVQQEASNPQDSPTQFYNGCLAGWAAGISTP